MSISESEVEAAGPSVAGPSVASTATGDARGAPESSDFGFGPGGDPLASSRPAPPYRTITDRELTWVLIRCDFVCACVALPLSLLLL